MPRDLKLAVRLVADAKGFKGAVSVSRQELDKLTGATGHAGKATDKLGSSVKTTHNRLLQYGLAFVSFSGLNRLAQNTLRLADAYTEISNRLRLVTQSERDLADVRENLLAISPDTRTSMEANAQLYSRLTLSVDNLNFSQADLLKVTELLNKQLLIGGSNASESAAGLVQFAQGLASGRLQGDELRSVMENLLGVQQGLLVGFRKLRQQGQIDIDVTRANIRDLAAQGTLSAELLLEAILASADDTERKFGQVNITIEGGLQQMKTATLAWVGDLDTALGLSNRIAFSLQQAAEAINEGDFGKFADAVDRGALGMDELLTIALLFAARRPLQKLSKGLLGVARSGISARVALAGLARGGLALIGGPAGLAITATFGLWQLYEALQGNNKQLREIIRTAPNAAAAMQQLKGLGLDRQDVSAELLVRQQQRAKLLARQRKLDERIQRARTNLQHIILRQQFKSITDNLIETEVDIDRLRKALLAGAAGMPTVGDGVDLDTIEITAYDKHLRELENLTADAYDKIQLLKRQRLDEVQKLLDDEKISEQDAARNRVAIHAIAGEEIKDLHTKGVIERHQQTLRGIKLEKAAQNAAERAHQERLDRENELARLQWELGEEELATQTNLQQTFKSGFEEYAESGKTAAQAVRDATVEGMSAMEDALTHFVATGKLEFGNLAQSILSDLARIAIRQSITGPLAAALGGLFGGKINDRGFLVDPGAGPVQLKHSGGIVGGETSIVRRMIDAGVFENAHRYHRGGLASDEVPAILQRGEMVIPRNLVQASQQPPQVEIHFENRGTPQREVGRTVQFDGQRTIVSVILDDMDRNGPIAQTMQRNFALNPAVS